MSEHMEILLVEDNPADRELTMRALRDAGVANAVAIAKDGAEALERLLPQDGAAPQPRLVLLDLKLPKVDGLEVLARLRADERTRTLPVVVLTSSREDQDVVESYRLGVNSYVVKPVDSDAFFRAVRELGLYWMVLNHIP